jgi:hypothetical protein
MYLIFKTMRFSSGHKYTILCQPHDLPPQWERRAIHINHGSNSTAKGSKAGQAAEQHKAGKKEPGQPLLLGKRSRKSAGSGPSSVVECMPGVPEAQALTSAKPRNTGWSQTA